jgi:chemotaxis protein MotB
MAPTEVKERLRAELEETLAGEFLGVAEVHSERRGVVVALLDTPLLFESGQAELKTRGRELLRKLVPISLRAGLPMRIEGHSDNVPIHTGQYPSNWELSVMRAAWVTRTFVDLGISPELLAVMGYGSTHPRYGNDSPQGRLGNRRVEIVFLLESPQASK